MIGGRTLGYDNGVCSRRREQGFSVGSSVLEIRGSPSSRDELGLAVGEGPVTS